jgi:hypothetical protein
VCPHCSSPYSPDGGEERGNGIGHRLIGAGTELEALGYDQVRSRIRIKLKGGKMIEGRYDVARGHPQKPMSWAELGDKFRDCADLVLPRKNAEEVIQFVGRLEQLRSLKPLLRVLSGGKDNSNKKTKVAKAGSKKWSRTRKR